MNIDMLLQEIAVKQNELNELMKNTENYISERVLEKSRALDELIVAYYDFVEEQNHSYAYLL